MSLFELWSDLPSAMVGWVSVLSIFTFLASLILMPLIVIKIPVDYFQKERRHEAKLRRVHPLSYLIVRILKNALAVLLIVGGFFMLVLPGQGLLTILIGVGVSDFPGKYRLERWIVNRPGILTAINWIRRKAKVEPLIPPAEITD
ncbi:MAG: hypothetical protein DHS20C01_26760 [marine bacterium B5-7]|nr:MAG: hypothetical protein DHS20C01_26760 [marine bacterium B5-7]